MSSSPTLSSELTSSLTDLWSRYAGKRQTIGRTEIHGNVVTFVLADSVGDFNRRTLAAPAPNGSGASVGLTLAGYKEDAIAAVAAVTRQRVATFLSSHDRDTDVATEVFELEASLLRGMPRSPVIPPASPMPPASPFPPASPLPPRIGGREPH